MRGVEVANEDESEGVIGEEEEDDSV